MKKHWNDFRFMDDWATYFFENAYEFLDAKGEWYLNTIQKVLYYIPRDGENMATAEVIAPTVETLFAIQGTSPSNPISNIKFMGLTFEYSTWLLPNSKGLMDVQGIFKD